MTIDEAIKRQTIFVQKTEGYFDDEDIEAAKLLIEAGKRHQALQQNPYYTLLKPLPGETPITDTKRSLHHIKQTLESKEVRK